MPSRTELKKISQTRLKEVKLLYNHRLYDGALYLSGYIIETALKARICKILDNNYPETGNVSKSFLTGIKNIFNEINRISRSDLKSALTSFNNVRTAISHNGIPVGINDKDIIRNLKSAKRIISFIDKAAYHHINLKSSITTWPV
jgi:hypothetical protein